MYLDCIVIDDYIVVISMLQFSIEILREYQFSKFPFEIEGFHS